MTRAALIRVLKTPSFFTYTLFFMGSYLALQAYILNFGLINQTIQGSFTLSYKFTLLFFIFTGYLQSLPLFYLITALLTTFLVGVNMTLLLLSYMKARSLGAMKITLGGSSLLAVVSSGCPSCGITALSVLGPSSSAFSFLLRDTRLQFIILALLILSIYYNLKKITAPATCTI